jgi:hypothetical protein
MLGPCKRQELDRMYYYFSEFRLCYFTATQCSTEFILTQVRFWAILWSPWLLFTWRATDTQARNILWRPVSKSQFGPIRVHIWVHTVATKLYSFKLPIKSRKFQEANSLINLANLDAKCPVLARLYNHFIKFGGPIIWWLTYYKSFTTFKFWELNIGCKIFIILPSTNLTTFYCVWTYVINRKWTKCALNEKGRSGVITGYR